MADKGFTVNDLLNELKVKLNLPPGEQNQRQMLLPITSLTGVRSELLKEGLIKPLHHSISMRMICCGSSCVSQMHPVCDGG